MRHHINCRSRFICSFAKLLVVSACILGCCDSRSTEQDFTAVPTGQGTPRAAFEKTMMGLLDGDYFAFESSIYQGPAVARAFYDCFQNSNSFRQELIQRFGDGAWEEFNAIEIEGVNMNIENMHADRTEVAAAFNEGIDFDVEGDVAYCLIPWNEGTQKMRRASNGAWYTDCGGTNSIAEIAEYWAIFFDSTNVGIDAAARRLDEGDSLQEVKRHFMEAKTAYSNRELKKLLN